MKTLNFYYIKHHKENLFPNGTFQAIALKGKLLSEYKKNHFTEEVADQKEYLVPTEYYDGKEVFVNGIGYIKAKQLKDVPVFSNKLEEWDDYVQKYGYQCLFYSLTGYSHDSHDCCAYQMIREFNSIICSKIDLKEYNEFINLFRKINAYQLKEFNSHPYIPQTEYDEYYFRPLFNIGGILNVRPNCDTIADDDKMEMFYRRIRCHVIRKQGHLSNKEIIEVIDKEINSGEFPIAMGERIRLLFGKECADIYDKLMTKFHLYIYEIY